MRSAGFQGRMACDEAPVVRRGAAILAKSHNKPRVSRGSMISSIQKVSAERKGERNFSNRSVIVANSASGSSAAAISAL